MQCASNTNKQVGGESDCRGLKRKQGDSCAASSDAADAPGFTITLRPCRRYDTIVSRADSWSGRSRGVGLVLGCLCSTPHCRLVFHCCMQVSTSFSTFAHVLATRERVGQNNKNFVSPSHMSSWSGGGLKTPVGPGRALIALEHAINLHVILIRLTRLLQIISLRLLVYNVEQRFRTEPPSQRASNRLVCVNRVLLCNLHRLATPPNRRCIRHQL